MPTTQPLSLTAADIMQTDLLTVSSSTRIGELAQMFDEHQVSGLPVTDGAGHIIGVVSLRDIVTHYAGDPDAKPGGHYFLAAHQSDDDGAFEVAIPEDATATVADVMSGQVHAVSKSATVPEISSRMLELGVHRLLVTDAQKRHVGLITTFDVLRAIAAK
ncbi:MAG: CBS domain-containing protein [Planctomycetes bacterium]|nr:CBS domain-containing protein [Planctomycetota bacterium]